MPRSLSRWGALTALSLTTLLAAAACTNHFEDLFSGASTTDPAEAGEAGDAAPGADGASDAAAPCASRAGLLALLPPSLGAQHHVDPSGSDSAPGTAEKPWKTPQKAVDSLAPGETAIVHAGVYPDPVTWTKAGTATAPITLAGDPRTPAIFTGTFELRGAFTRVTGLVFDGALRTGTVYPLLAARSSDLEISNNEFRGAKRVGLEAFVEGGMNPDRLRIVANWFHDGAQGMAIHAGTGTLVASNLLHDHSDVGILLDPSPQQTSVLANTVARGRVGVVVGASSSATAGDGIIVNNVITSHTAQGIIGAGSGARSSARRNLLFADTPAVAGTVTDVDNVIGVAPQFVAADDFHLQAGSPALGAADLAFTPVSDRDGRCRPIGAPDLGAFEQ